VIDVVLVVLLTEAERTQRAVTVLVIMLLVVACLLAALTAWYWHHTSPGRRARQLNLDRRQIDLTQPQLRDLNQPPGYSHDPFPTGQQPRQPPQPQQPPQYR
jgi:hypothetical protein